MSNEADGDGDGRKNPGVDDAPKAPPGDGPGEHAGGAGDGDASDWNRLWDDFSHWRFGRRKIEDVLAIVEAGLPGVRPDYRRRYDFTLDKAIELLEREHSIWEENLLPRLNKARQGKMLPPWPL